MTDLSVSLHAQDDVTTLKLVGEIDLGNADELREAISSAMKRQGLRLLVVDLDKVSFIDSTGISALLYGLRMASQHGRAFQASNPRDIVRRILQVSGVWEYLNGEATVDWSRRSRSATAD